MVWLLFTVEVVINKLSKSFIILGFSILLYLGSIFGTSVLTNYHLKYLRSLGDNVVLIHNLAGSGATGFVIKGRSGKLYTMTNSHVCGLEENGTILGRYQGSDYVLNVIKKFPMNDLCVLSAPKTAKQYFKVASSFKLGESSYAIGYPQLEPLSLVVGELSDLLTVRVVTKINGTPQECTGPTYEYTTDLPPEAMIFGVFSTCVRSVQANSSSMIISPGNSGSPVVNIWGSVIGVVFAANQFGTRSYIVPLSDLKLFLKDL